MLPSDIDLILEGFITQGWNKPEDVLNTYLSEQESGERTVVIAEVDGKIAGYVTLLKECKDAVPYLGQNIPEVKDFIVFKTF